MWFEQIGIISKNQGFVKVGFHCRNCGNFDILNLPQDDFSDKILENEYCELCFTRNRLAREIRYSRALYRELRRMHRYNKIYKQIFE